METPQSRTPTVHERKLEPRGGHSTRLIFTLNLDSATFVRRRRHWVPVQQYVLKNSLLAAVGYLELGNAADFAANVWNETPVPTYAIVLMALGGTVALAMALFAFYDARLSWRNVCILRKERYALLDHRGTELEKGGAGDPVVNEDVAIESLLDVNHRELGTELVERILPDVLLGVGAVLVGTGTLMAIGGSNHKVWFASNLLSGYIGNSPPAIYALANLLWSVYVCVRASRHGRAAVKELDPELVRSHLRPRLRAIEVHALVNGTTGIVSGMASLVTATRWWGYVVLIPCIMASAWCNHFWRRTIAYERPFQQRPERLSKVALLDALQAASSARQVLEEAKSSSSKASSLLKQHSPETEVVLRSVLDFLVSNDLFEGFCLHLLCCPSLPEAIFNPNDDEVVVITLQQLLDSDLCYVPQVLEIADQWVDDVGLRHFQYRERFLLEILGCYLTRVNLPSSTSL